MQEAYVRAYQHLNQFAGTAKFSTWLTKIAVHEALARVRRRGRNGGESSLDTSLYIMDSVRTAIPDPERQAYDHELRLALEGAIAALPDSYRLVFRRVSTTLRHSDTEFREYFRLSFVVC
jgi:RNA polymerase sigma-70 factor (ECF subfamily)